MSLSPETATAWAEALESNMYVSFPLLFGAIPNAVCELKPEITRCATGIPHPMMNHVCFTRFADETADARIRETIAWFRERHVPMLWWTGPSSRPTDLESRLEAQGLVRGHTMPGMALDLTTWTETPERSEGIVLREVSDAAMFRAWSRVCCVGNGMPDSIVEAFSAAGARLGFGTERPIRSFLAFVDGKPVVTSMLVKSEEIAGVYCIATVPEARRKGCGFAVTQACLQAGKEAGCRLAILQSSQMGLPIYLRLGFTEVCKITTFLWREQETEETHE